jgi:hypothetical protein
MRHPGPDLLSLARRVAHLTSATPLVHAASPLNWEAELARLCSARRAGERVEPAFVYRRPAIDPSAIDALDALAAELDPLGAPFASLASRAREASLEMRLADALGGPAFAPLARARFGCAPEADARALAWAALPAADGDDDEPRTLSCDEAHPMSLISVMRRAAGERRLPMRVLVRDGMAALAATGDGVLLVARGRPLALRDVRRTVLHEIEGHALPWLARQGGPLPASIRPARAADAEEGGALLIEQRAGFLDRARRKELGLRHVAASLAHQVVPFGNITEQLESLGAHPMTAIRIAARVVRGGGLGRERVYLPWLWRLRAGGSLPGG